MSRWSLTDTAGGLLALTPSGRTVTLANLP
jgi:hypothetical protein